jgi:hypothetical protein
MAPLFSDQRHTRVLRLTGGPTLPSEFLCSRVTLKISMPPPFPTSSGYLQWNNHYLGHILFFGSYTVKMDTLTSNRRSIFLCLPCSLRHHLCRAAPSISRRTAAQRAALWLRLTPPICRPHAVPPPHVTPPLARAASRPRTTPPPHAAPLPTRVAPPPHTMPPSFAMYLNRFGRCRHCSIFGARRKRNQKWIMFCSIRWRDIGRLQLFCKTCFRI